MIAESSSPSGPAVAWGFPVKPGRRRRDHHGGTFFYAKAPTCSGTSLLSNLLIALADYYLDSAIRLSAL